MRSLRDLLMPREGVGPPPTLLLDQGQPPKLTLYLLSRREHPLQRRLVLKAGEDKEAPHEPQRSAAPKESRSTSG